MKCRSLTAIFICREKMPGFILLENVEHREIRFGLHGNQKQGIIGHYLTFMMLLEI